MSVSVVVAVLISGFTALSGFLMGSMRYASRVAVLENQFSNIQRDLTALSGTVNALALRFAPNTVFTNG